MKSKKLVADPDPEIAAIGVLSEALGKLSPEARTRVLSYVCDKLKIAVPIPGSGDARHRKDAEDERDAAANEGGAEQPGVSEDGLEGISPVAKKWMVRNGLKAQELSAIFSLGVDEIDLIAKAIPGDGKKDKMHSVLLLKGIAAYLGSGSPRFGYGELKEACVHYKAYDGTNFATFLKNFSAEVSGDKRTAFTLTARGVANATEIVKKMLELGNAN